MIFTLDTARAPRRDEGRQAGFCQKCINRFARGLVKPVISVLNALQHENAIRHNHRAHIQTAPLKLAHANAAPQTFPTHNFIGPWAHLHVVATRSSLRTNQNYQKN